MPSIQSMDSFILMTSLELPSKSAVMVPLLSMAKTSFCFDYTISSSGVDGDGQSRDRTKAIGQHCINVLPDTEYKATITELDLAPQKSMVAPLEPGGDLDEWSIDQIIVTDDKTGSSTTITSPASGQAIELMNGNLTLTFTNDDPPQRIMAYTPNEDSLREVGETDELVDSSDYAGKTSNGEVFYETLTLRISGANDPPTPENDVLTVREGDEAASCVLSNDSDPDAGDSLKVWSVLDSDNRAITLGQAQALPEGGTLTMDEGGCYRFNTGSDFASLKPGESRRVCFTYWVCDEAQASSEAVACIEISGSNTAPVAEDDSESTDPFIPVSSTMFANDSDPEGDRLTVTSINGDR